MEDAVVLGNLLSKINSKSDIKWFLSSFQEIRHDRSRAVRLSEQEKVNFSAMPPGPQRDMRDMYMRSQMQLRQSNWIDCSESYLRKSWEEFRDLFGYDAFDDADTWWVEWGALYEHAKSKETPYEGIFDGQVTVQKARQITSDF